MVEHPTYVALFMLLGFAANEIDLIYVDVHETTVLRDDAMIQYRRLLSPNGFISLTRISWSIITLIMCFHIHDKGL